MSSYSHSFPSFWQSPHGPITSWESSLKANIELIFYRAACGCWHVSDAHLDSPRGQSTNPELGCLLKRAVAASDTRSGFTLHSPLDVQNSRQSTTVVWPLAYLLATAAGKFGPEGFLCSKTHLQFEPHCQRLAVHLAPLLELGSKWGRGSSGHPGLHTPHPLNHPTPIVSRTHWHVNVHLPCGTNCDLVDG